MSAVYDSDKTTNKTNSASANIYEGCTADIRQSEAPVLDVAHTLFRKRYRQLTAAEVMLHDDIKDKADELAKLIGMLNPGVYSKLVGVSPSDLLHAPRECDPAHVTLALRHLEDAVYRAVKALTA